MRKIDATGGWLHYPPLEFYYMQGEVNVEPVQFILPKTREEVDLTALSYQIKAVSEDYGTEATWILPKKLTDEHILLNWEITRELTLMPGRVMLTLTGTDTKNNVIAKWTGNPAIIRKDPQGTAPVPPPDELEQFQQQVNEAVEQITGALEEADSALTEVKPVLEDAAETAKELTGESESLRQVVNVLENQTIPNLTSYVEQAQQNVAGMVESTQSSATAAQEAAAKAESARQQAEQAQQNIATESNAIKERYEGTLEAAKQAAASAQSAKSSADTATAAINTVSTYAKDVEQWKNETEEARQAAVEVVKKYPRINEDGWWEVYNPVEGKYEQTDSRAQLVPRGAYSADETYLPLDLVTDGTEGKATYLALCQSTGAPLDDTDKWMKLVEAVKGDKGDTGKGLQILGQYPDLETLQSAVPSPSVGDAYGVGESAPYNIYIWDGSRWIDNGKLEGPRGENGAQGETGPAGQDGKSAYQYAKQAGYQGSESEFGEDLKSVPDKAVIDLDQVQVMSDDWSMDSGTGLYCVQPELSSPLGTREYCEISLSINDLEKIDSHLIPVTESDEQGYVFKVYTQTIPSGDITLQVKRITYRNNTII